VLAVLGDADVLPLADASVGLLWCRDALEMFDDPALALREFARVLMAGSGCVLYLPLPTPALAEAERLEMLETGMPEWWMGGRASVDAAIRAAGFAVVDFSLTSPDYTESVLLNDPAVITGQLLEHIQLRRGRAEMEAAIGPEWYQQFLVWSRWQMYLALGKLETGLWLLRKPA
jgi:SAM-dependent methyltransferase